MAADGREHGAQSVALASAALRILFFVTMTWIVLFASDRGILASVGNLGVQTLYIIALFLALMSLSKADISYRALMPTMTMGIALAWCWASVTWSIDPSTTLVRVTLTTVLVITIFISTGIIGYDRSMHIYRNSLILVILLSYIWVFVFPDSGIQLPKGPLDSDSGASWRGIMLEKNSAGAVCAVAALYFIFCERKLSQIYRFIIVALYLIFLWQTKSKTSIIFFAAMLPIGFFSSFFTNYLKTLSFILAPVLICAAVVYWAELISPFSNALYDQRAFTGRGPIWATLIGYIKDHWLLGSGYGSFWSIGPSSPVFYYTNYKWVQGLAIGHNGYLDMFSQVGIIGLILILIAIAIVPIARLFHSNRLRQSQFAFFLTTLLFSLGNNAMESSLFDRNHPLNIMTIFVIALIGVAERENVLRQRSLPTPPPERLLPAASPARALPR